ncbi:MAG TPA: glucose-1-phosphate adenylyltransferase, partial [Lachnospiraceae bacterium]|nr:glucose-1-phosphate adenylyltransferase [Lachnospiraceae bacterium]
AENAHIGQGAVIGCGDAVPNRVKPKIYGYGLAVVGEDTEIPPNVRIGRNTAVTGRTVPEDYPDGQLASGGILDKAGVVS